MSIVTIYTDASLCAESGACGWGAWVRRDGDTRTAGGPFRLSMGDSGRAEMAAAANAVSFAVKSGMVGRGDFLVIVSDSAELVARFADPESIHNPRCGAMVSVIRKLAESHDFRFRANKVKGHSSHDGGRSFVNRLVDGEARRHMLTARTRLHDERALPARADPGVKAFAPVETSRSAGPLSAFPVSARQAGPEISLAVSRPVSLPLLSDYTPLSVMADLYERGWVLRRQMEKAIELTVARARVDSPSAFVKACQAAGLIRMTAGPDRPELAVKVSAADYASALLSARTTVQEFRTSVRSCTFFSAPNASQASADYVAQCVKMAGYDGISYADGPDGPAILVLEAGQVQADATEKPSASKFLTGVMAA